MSRVPRIRFKGFEEDWEQRKLSEIYKNICNAYVGTATPYYVEDGHFYLEANNVKDGKINYNSQIFINDNFYESQKDKWLNSGDMVMVQSGHVGHAAVIPEELENTVAHALILFKNAKVKIEPYFLNYQYQTLNFKRKIENITVGNTIKHILASDMKEYMVYVSRFAEQIIVSKYFQTLDHLITLHQRKLEKLKIIKKSMLENLFPQNGEKTPKIRFSGFNKDWEQRKLGEVGKARSGIGFPESEQGGTIGTPFFKVSDMNIDGNENEMTAANNYVTTAQIVAHKWSPIEELPAIFFAKVGAAVMLNRKRLCRFPFLLDNNTMAYSLDKTKWDADFAKALFETVDLTSLVQVGALPSYNSGDIEAMEILLPSLSEQSQIGAFFKKIDHLITLHQSKLEKLQKIKKSMLESMFV